MIGRSLVIFQRGNNKNELHEVNSWDFALGCRDEDFEKQIVKEAKKKKWKPEDVVSDAEVEAIVNATNCIGPKHPGYHKWASDCVMVINLSGDPNLPNPATVKAERRKKEAERKSQALKQLQQFIPELLKLRKAVPEGSVTFEVDLRVKVRVKYIVSTPVCTVDVFGKNGKKVDYASWLIDHEELKGQPEMKPVFNCPHRKAYKKRCKELAKSLGLSSGDVEDAVYFAEVKQKEKKKTAKAKRKQKQ